ncbi:hypothetical protein H4J59_08210 [Colwellia sp. MB02u-10]|uniref:hypothetical protein n=1 Tax=Colwellia sp. MB02u-10 TaxID=2759828 RepID=UPI0015F5327F|nr:hypothetical protein [Colwellia sp. MB02u-10]MBA6340970.1 hypothetical protein [Colwellia sp. MB02u-10]
MKIKNLLIFLFLFYPSVSVAGPWEEFQSEFKQLMDGLIELGEEAERDYTLGQMAKLHRDLLRVERSKEDLVFILENPNIYYENLAETLAEARESTESSRKRLEDIGNKVAVLSKNASELEQILSDSLRSRKSWLSQVDLSNVRGSDNLIDEGKHAIKALRSSRIKLEEYLRLAK